MIGKTILHYKIIEKLGEGGMGVVYKAEDTKLDRTVAIKFLPRHVSANKEEKQRFVIEAKAAAALNHPNIATIHAIEDADDEMFIVMEYIEGRELKDITNPPSSPLTKGGLEGGRLPVEEVINYAIQIAEGLQAAHKKGIVHRDIKSSNIMITKDGKVKIMDFGLAKMRGNPHLTQAGSTVGTPYYMSPEQARGEAVDHRTDIWSFGVLFFEMLTGQLPFKGDYEQAVLYSILNEEPNPLAALRTDAPLEMEGIVNKCLQKEVPNRYQHIEEIISDLELLKDNGHLSNKSSSRRIIETKTKKNFVALWIIPGVLLLAVLGLFLFYSGESANIPDRKMLVVLPFENLGPTEEDYFVDGMTEEITSRLAMIQSLGVISRKSALQYRDSNKSIKQISAELGVDYVLEGTVRWARDAEGSERVRITPQLIRAKDDIHLWADVYERIIEDVFQVQSEIAHSVVEQLGVTLLEPEKQKLTAKPTDNIDAYHRYLRGRYFLGLPHFTIDFWNQAIDNFEQAVTLDSSFALAYSELARAHSRLYFVRYDLSQQRLDKAKKAADKAVELAKESPEVHLNIGYYYLWALRDPERALEEFTIAEKHLPNNVELLKAKASLYQTQGKWQAVIETLERAVELSPRDASALSELTFSFWFDHQYEKAMITCNQTISVAPETTWPYLYKANIIWNTTGPNEVSRAALNNVSSDHGWWLWSWYWQEVGERNFDNAFNLLPKTDGKWMKIKIYARPKSMLRAFIYDFLGESDKAKAAYDSARIMLEEEIKISPDDPRYHSSLGLAYAGLGMRDKAIREGKKAIELLPVSKDAVYGVMFVYDLAAIYTMTGDYDSAIDQIEFLMSIPSIVSKSWLKMDVRFAPLFNHPEFMKLLEKYPV